MPPPAAPTSTKEQVGAALQTAGQYAGGSTVWTPQNAEELGLDPARGYVARGTPTDVPIPSPTPPPPLTTHPTVGPTILGIPVLPQPGEATRPAPAPAPSQQSQQSGAVPKGFIPDEENEGQAGALPKGFIPDEQKEEEKPLPKGFVPEEEHAKEAAAPSTTPATPMPSGTGVGAPQGVSAPLIPGRDAHINALIASGKTPGEAQAIADGQEPKTITGETPQPKPALAPKTEQPQQAQGDTVDWGRLGYKSFEEYQKFVTGLPAGMTVTRGPGTTATITKGTQAEPSTPTAPEAPPKVVEGNKIQGTSTIFGLNYDGSVDPGDNGRGFFGGVNTRNPNLKAVAVPVDVLEKVFGHFAQVNAQGGYDMVDTPEARAIVKAIQSAHVEAIGPDGKIHKFPIVDIQGSLKGHPGKVLDLTYGAAKEMGFADNHGISYQIIGGDGKPYPIPDNIEFAGGGSKGPTTGPGGPAGPWISVGGAPSGGGAAPAQFRGPPEGGGGGAQPDYSPSESRAEPISLAGLGGLLAGGVAAGSLFRGGGGQPRARRPAEEEPQLPSGGMKQANVLGVQTISPGPPPPAPSSLQAQLLPPPAAPALPPPSAAPQPAMAPIKGPDPAVVKALMKRGFTRQQAEAFAAKATVSKPGTAAITGGASFKPPAQPAGALPAKQAPPAPVPPAKQAPPATTAPPAPAAKAPSPSDVPPAVFEAAAHNMRPLGYRAAVKLTNGEVFSGPEHAHALDNAFENASMRVTDATTHYGFVDKNQHFIGMDEADRILEKNWYKQRNLPEPPAKAPLPPPAEGATRIGPEGSTIGVPNPPGGPSPDDPRVKKQKDNLTKGEHFVPGDDFHDQLLSGLPGGHGGRQRQILGQAEQAISDRSPLHISYISAPKEAAKFPTRESRRIQYDEHSPEARLMGTTEGQLVGHSMIPVAVGISPSRKAGEPHQSYIQGISTNILANNFQHVNDKLAAIGRKTPYQQLGQKFFNDLEGFFANLNAGHTATGRGHVLGTEDHPSEPDRSHVPYKLSRLEADFIGTVLNNTAAFAKHGDAEALRQLARVNGTLITPEGETNRLRHEIEQREPGWRQRVLEPSIRSFKTGLIHEVHPDEEHMPATIRPGKEFQDLTRAIARTSERGRPDVPVAASLHHTFADNKAINQIERDFSQERITEQEARARLQALGEDPDEFQFIGGSGGLITPYEENPEAITPEEHTELKTNLRKQWIGGKMPIEDYRRKAAEVPLPEKPSQPPASSPGVPKPESETPEETPPAAPKPPVSTPKPKPAQQPPATFEKLYRGMAAGGQGHYYSPDKEWARQFTQSGQEHEIQERHVKSDDIHEPDEPVEANDTEGVDKAISDAKAAGKKAVRLSEGKDQPDSVHVFDKSALIRPSKVAGTEAKPEPPAPDEPPPAKKAAHVFKSVTPEEFIAHRNKSAKPEFLSDLKPEEIQNHKLFTNQDNTIGAAVSPEGDIQNVFNNGGEKGAGAHALAHAIEHHGGRTLDAYDGFLPDYYRQFGFHETGRTKFNPEFAPKWDTTKHGTPDVVHMGWGGHPEGGPEAAIARAKDKSQTNWIPNEQSTLYDDDFDAQKARSREFAQRAVAGGTKDYRAARVEQGAKTLSARGAAQPGSGAAPRGAVGPPPAPSGPAKKAAKEPPAPRPISAATQKVLGPQPKNKKQAKLWQQAGERLDTQVAEGIPLEVDRGERGKFKTDPKGKVLYKKTPYDIANAPLLQKQGKALGQELNKQTGKMAMAKPPKDVEDDLDQLDPEERLTPFLNPTDRKRVAHLNDISAVDTYAEKIHGLYKSIEDLPEVMKGKNWYDEAVNLLRKHFGPHADLMANLLGATSAGNKVKINYNMALDAYHQFLRGHYDEAIKLYNQAYDIQQSGKGALMKHIIDNGIHTALGKDAPDTDERAMLHWIEHHNLTPRSSGGKLFGHNSLQVLKVLAHNWEEQAGGPKTPNFAANLNGRSMQATIDMWAARTMRRLGFEGHTSEPWMIQPAGETGVHNVDFGLSQLAFKKAADKIGIKPSALQAILWFAEQKEWQKRGWEREEDPDERDYRPMLKKYQRPGDITEAQAGKFHPSVPELEARLKGAGGGVLKMQGGGLVPDDPDPDPALQGQTQPAQAREIPGLIQQQQVQRPNQPSEVPGLMQQGQGQTQPAQLTGPAPMQGQTQPVQPTGPPPAAPSGPSYLNTKFDPDPDAPYLKAAAGGAQQGPFPGGVRTESMWMPGQRLTHDLKWGAAEGGKHLMTNSDIAMSQDLMKKYGLKLGDRVDVLDSQGNVLYPNQYIGDVSYRSPGKPNSNTIELWGRKDIGYSSIRPAAPEPAPGD